MILDESPAATGESYRHTDLVPLTTTASVALTQAAQLSSEIPSLEPQEEEIAASDADVASVSEVSSASDTVPLLQVNALYVSRPIEFLGTLAPPQLLQELLGRVLLGGIGRLYFERQPNQGRILWSQDGVLQSVLEGLSLRTFQGVILELKRLVNLPLIPITQPKQVEIERRYQQEELLLRLRVMPGTHGEEATLQVLRGAALKFYQRQQLEKLGQDALKLAQQLQRKLSEIRARAYRNPLPLEALPALNQMMEGLDKQMEALVELQTHQDSDKPAH